MISYYCMYRTVDGKCTRVPLPMSRMLQTQEQRSATQQTQNNLTSFQCLKQCTHMHASKHDLPQSVVTSASSQFYRSERRRKQIYIFDRIRQLL